MSYGSGYSPAAPADRNHEHEEIDDLQSEVEGLRRDVDALEEFKEETERALGGVDLDEMGSDLSEAGSSISSLVEQVNGLKSQVAWLSKVVVHAGLAPVADLAFDTGERALATTTARGREAEERMFTTADRYTRESLVEECEQVGQENAAAVARAAKATTVMGETRRSDLVHLKASQTLTAANTEIHRTATRHKAIAERATQYARDLAADDAVVTETKAVRAEACAAYAQLLTRLRTRLVAEVERGAVLPTWFATTSGPTAPAGDTTGWYETAARVLAYRLVYKVERADSALGAAPAQASQRARFELYGELHLMLRTRDWSAR